MTRILLLLFLITTLNICIGQNLVINPGFENYSSLPCDFDTSASQFETLMNDWTVPNHTTPDICSPLISSACNYGNPLSPGSAGLQNPKSGNVMIGMVCENGGYNEYLQVPLTSPLITGNSYQAAMYVSLASKSDFASNGIGMYFSDTMISDPLFDGANYSPQLLDTATISDTANWTLISGCFTATTAANYLIIGNYFSPCAHGSFLGGGWPMSYYFFDDISVIQIPECSNGKLSCSDGMDEHQHILPGIFPNPISDLLTIQNLSAQTKIEIFNLLGARVIECKSPSENLTIDMRSCAKGIYILHLIEDQNESTLKLIKL